MAVVARALHHLNLHPGDHHQVVLAVQAHPVVALRVDRQIDAMALAPTHVQVLRVQVQVLTAMAQLPVVAQQVVATQLIAVHIQVVVRRVDRQIDAMVLVILHVKSALTVHAGAAQVHVQDLHVRVKVVLTEIVTHVHLLIVPIARHVLMVTATHVRRAQVPIVVLRVDRQIDATALLRVHRPIVQRLARTVIATRVHLPIVPAEVIHTVAIVQKLVMIVGIARLLVLANAVVVQIAPVAGLLMTVKSVHVVALAKSA